MIRKNTFTIPGLTENFTQSPFSQLVSEDSYHLYLAVQSRITQLASSDRLEILDLGTGCGIILLMLAKDWATPFYTGIELLESLTEIATANFRRLIECVGHRDYALFTADYSHLEHLLPDKKFHLIVSNPPYYPKGMGKLNPVYEKAVARHELVGNMATLLQTIKKFLSPDGRAYVLYPEKRQTEVKRLCHQNQLTIQAEQYVDATATKKKIIYEILPNFPS